GRSAMASGSGARGSACGPGRQATSRSRRFRLDSPDESAGGASAIFSDGWGVQRSDIVLIETLEADGASPEDVHARMAALHEAGLHAQAIALVADGRAGDPRGTGLW